MHLQTVGVFVLVLVCQCYTGPSSANNFRNGTGGLLSLDYREIARQNKITEQILQNYLEKRLFPNNHRPSKAPTIWEILPRARKKPASQPVNNNIQDVLSTKQETLESGESEQSLSFYDNEITEQEEQRALELFLQDCSGNNCADETFLPTTRWTMPLNKLGTKRYYLGIFFKANYFKASQYCRYHGMHLASISSQEENDKVEKYIQDVGLGQEHFWTSGTDLADEGKFFWMSTGMPITYTNWNAGEPNNFQYENGEEENCLELWNRDGKGLRWNDSPCSFETYFICEVQA